MMALVTALLAVIGSLFCLIAAVGVVRMPDLFLRMHGATKAGTLGSGLILFAVALAAADLEVTIKALATILFLMVSAPVAAHLIGRAAWRRGVSMWRHGRHQPPEPPA